MFDEYDDDLTQDNVESSNTDMDKVVGVLDAAGIEFSEKIHGRSGTILILDNGVAFDFDNEGVLLSITPTLEKKK